MAGVSEISIGNSLLHSNIMKAARARRDNMGGGAKNYHERIVRDPRVCGGQAVFKGTRVTLRTVLASLAEGDSPQQILSDFPTLKPEDIQAAIVFAATSAQEDLPVPGLPPIFHENQA
jgi:uncharacterized protein (DUF433 family)